MIGLQNVIIKVCKSRDLIFVFATWKRPKFSPKVPNTYPWGASTTRRISPSIGLGDARLWQLPSHPHKVSFCLRRFWCLFYAHIWSTCESWAKFQIEKINQFDKKNINVHRFFHVVTRKKLLLTEKKFAESFSEINIANT